MITRKITTSGNSAVITLSPDLLALLGVAVGDTVVLDVAKGEIRVRAMTDEDRADRFQKTKRRVVAKHTGLLKRLAAADAGKKVNELFFLAKEEVLELHEEALRIAGGAAGFLNEGALDSAIAAAENRYHYEQAELFACAATYVHHIANAHAFLDANKRTAVLAMAAFLDLNGAELTATEDELFAFVMGIATGEITRDDAERWVISNARLLPA